MSSSKRVEDARKAFKRGDKQASALAHTDNAISTANEEHGGDRNVGIEHMFKDGKLDKLHNGPVYWFDSSDTFPTTVPGI